MFRSPSRNQRSKGFKVKHVLQICLLLAVCFWLIYQVKHSHDKKKEFDAHDAKISVKMQNADDIMKFGRKDLQPRVEEEATKNEKSGDEDNEEEEEAGGIDEEEVKHDEEQEEEESKADEREDEGRGGGDDEIDENDTERGEGESDHEEEFLEEEKEREDEGDEKEKGEKEGEERDEQPENEKETDDQPENEREAEDQDHDGGGRNAHGAREEHYKADDASSAVAHDTQISGSETDKMEDFDENTLEQENKPDNSGERSTEQKYLKPEEVELVENKAPSNVTDNEEKGAEFGLSKSENSSLPNLPITESDVQNEVKNNSSEVIVKTSDSGPQNATETTSGLVQDQNTTGEGINIEEGSNLQNTILEQKTNFTTASDDKQTSSETENTDVTRGESLNSYSSDATTVAEKNPDSSTSKEDTDATQNEKPETRNGSEETDENSASSSKNENADSFPHDPIDVSDSTIPQEEKEQPTDLDKVPGIRTEVNDKKEGIGAE